MHTVNYTKILESSKLYRASSDERKRQIIQAASNPLNRQLMEQLVDYLDPEYQTAEYVDPESDQHDNVDLSDDFDTADTDSAHGDVTEESSPDAPAANHTAIPDMEMPIPDQPEESTDAESVEDLDAPPADAEEPPEEVISEATDVDTDITVTLKEFLESDESTAGVSRISVREDANELWIYYQDRVNLNKIMSDVVEALHRSAYSSLEFNRLARTDNAIVFEL